MKKVSFIYFLFLNIVPITGQIVDSVIMDSIIIVPQSLRNGMAKQKNIIQNVGKNSILNLNEIISQETNTYFKTYGIGSIATGSIRGGSAGQNILLWNGVPIQSPMLGQLDYSLIPVYLLDGVSVNKGGFSSEWGSGAIGGIIHTNSNTTTDNNINLTLSRASFGFEQIGITAGLVCSKFSVNHKYISSRSNNDFQYSLTNGIRKRQTHAAFKQWATQHSLAYKWDTKNQSQLHLWYQESDREIPPQTTQNNSEATQLDEILRIVGSHELLFNKWKHKLKAAFINESLSYSDPLSFLFPALSNFQSIFAEYEAQYYIYQHFQLNFGVQLNKVNANAAAYRQTQSQSTQAFFQSLKWEKGMFIQLISLRLEKFDNRWNPITPGYRVKFSKSNIDIQAKISRNYKNPTTNDRFWIPGGNVDLLPESGWSQEMSLTYRIHKNIVYNFHLFNRNVNNWIQWNLSSNGNYFEAKNLKKVWSRGIEQQLTITRKINKKHSFRSSVMLDYLKSTDESNIQLIYTPNFSGTINLIYNYHGLQAKYHQKWTGQVLGINEEVNDWTISNVSLEYRWHNVSITTELNNLFNNQYRVIERRPMPGRNYLLGFSLDINKN